MNLVCCREEKKAGCAWNTVGKMGRLELDEAEEGGTGQIRPGFKIM